jgi:hypothetical protein
MRTPAMVMVATVFSFQGLLQRLGDEVGARPASS